MMFPEMESSVESPPVTESLNEGGNPTDTAEVHSQGPNLPATAPAATCPNCGGTEFDEDGDCVECWEPGVARGKSKED